MTALLLQANGSGTGRFVVLAILGLISVGVSLQLLRYVRQRPERPAPWGVGDFFVLFVLWFMIQVMVSGILQSAASARLDEALADSPMFSVVQARIRAWLLSTPWIGMASVITANVGVTALALLRVRLAGAGPRSLGLAPVEPMRSGLSAIVVLLGAWFPFILFALAWFLLLEFFGVPAIEQAPVVALRRAAEAGEFAIVVGMVIAVCVAAPIGEEILFRGLLFRALERSSGVAVASVVSSALFTLIHFSVAAAGPIFVLALALAAVYARTRNLWGCILLHAAFNAVNVITTIRG